MAEDVNLSHDSISGLSNDDIVANIYEGGFKTWECSVDLSDYVWSTFDISDSGLPKDYSIIEVSTRSSKNFT